MDMRHRSQSCLKSGPVLLPWGTGIRLSGRGSKTQELGLLQPKVSMVALILVPPELKVSFRRGRFECAEPQGLQSLIFAQCME